MPYRGTTAIYPWWGLSRFNSCRVNLRTVTGAFRSQLLQNGSLVGSGVSLGYVTAAFPACTPLSNRQWDSRFVPVKAVCIFILLRNIA
jgi:hypothetical protein